MATAKKTTQTHGYVTDAYTKLLKRTAEESGATQQQLEKVAGVGRQTLWRATKVEQATVSSAFALRDALVIVTKEPLPPPIVSIRDQNDYDWYEAGQLLKELDFNKFSDVLEEIKRVVSATKQDHKSMTSLRTLLHPTVSDADGND